MPVTVHPPGFDREDHRLAPPRPDLAGGLHITRQVDVVPLPLLEALGNDRAQESLDHPVVEHLGGRSLRKLQVDVGAVALVGPDQVAGPVERVPPLVVGLDALDEFVVGDGEAVLPCGCQQVVHRHPPAGPEGQAEFVGGVAEVLPQELADGDEPVVHDLVSHHPGSATAPFSPRIRRGGTTRRSPGHAPGRCPSAARRPAGGRSAQARPGGGRRRHGCGPSP